MSSSDLPAEYQTAEGLRTLANFLRSQNGVKSRSGIEHEKRVDYFKGDYILHISHFSTLTSRVYQISVPHSSILLLKVRDSLKVSWSRRNGLSLFQRLPIRVLLSLWPERLFKAHSSIGLRRLTERRAS